VKQKDTVGRPDIDAFEKAMRRSKRGKGFFVSFDYTEDALQVIDRFVTVHLASVRGRGGDGSSPPLPRALGRPEQLQRFFKADHAIIIPLTVKEIGSSGIIW